MKLLVENSEQRGYLSQNNYIERKVEKVINMLKDTIYKIDTDIEEMTAVKLMLCTSWLENLLDNLSPRE